MEQSGNKGILLRFRQLVYKIADFAGYLFDLFIIVMIITVLFFPEPIFNSFKNKLIRIFENKIPGYTIKADKIRYSLWENCLEFNLLSIMAVDSSLTCNISNISTYGINWFEYLHNGNIFESVLKKMSVNVNNCTVYLRKADYKLRFGGLHLSVSDSELTISRFVFRPISSDDRFFAKSKFRKTRIIIRIPSFEAEGVTFPNMFEGKKYHISLIKIKNATLDNLINIDKPANKNSSKPLMPNEVFSSIRDTILLDSLSIINSQLVHGERHKVGEKPAVLMFNMVQLRAKNIVNHTSGNKSSAFFYSSARIMDAAIMRLQISYPMSSRNFSLHYWGAFGKMDLVNLNPFLEKAEHIRIESGNLDSVYYDIHIRKGDASGHVNALYRNLKIELLNKEKNSTAPLKEKIATFLANLIKIRHNNLPNTIIQLKTGEVKYSRHENDSIINCLWFPLRSGLTDIVGF